MVGTLISYEKEAYDYILVLSHFPVEAFTVFCILATCIICKHTMLDIFILFTNNNTHIAGQLPVNF